VPFLNNNDTNIINNMDNLVNMCSRENPIYDSNTKKDFDTCEISNSINFLEEQNKSQTQMNDKIIGNVPLFPKQKQITSSQNIHDIPKYNYRYLISQCFQFNSSNNNEYNNYLHLINLVNACEHIDEYYLTKKLLLESQVYHLTQNFEQLMTLATKIIKYKSRKNENNFEQKHKTISMNAQLIKVCLRIANMFKNTNNYFCGLYWINKIHNYFKINNVNISKGNLQKYAEEANNLKNELNQKRKIFIENIIKTKHELKCNFNETESTSKYYINKKWYDDYNEFINNINNNIHIEYNENLTFPREIENYLLLSGKEMLEKNEYIINDSSKENAKVIGETEWMFLKNKFGCTNEMKITSNQNSNQTYKILVLDPHAKGKKDFSSLKPRYLQLDKEICVIDYLKQKYNHFESCNIYTYNANLSKKQKKEILFDITYFYSLTKEKNIPIRSDLLINVTQNNENILNNFFFVDLDNYISIKQINKCFSCQLHENSISCDGCILIKPTIQFCSDNCLNTHKNNYHNYICKYQTFQYNTKILLNKSKIPNNYNLIGFINLGNTCFMNSGFQCIFHCDAFVNYFLDKQYLKEPLNSIEDISITKAFTNLAQQIQYSNESFLSPSQLRSAFIRKEDKYDNYEQHDSPELIIDFLDQISMELNRSKSTVYETKKNSLTTVTPFNSLNEKLNKQNSIVDDLFFGQSRYKYICTNEKCGFVNNYFENFLLLDLSIPSDKGLKYFVKFKYFQFSKIKPEIKQFEVKLNTRTVYDFKLLNNTNEFNFEMFMFRDDNEHNIPYKLEDNDIIFEIHKEQDITLIDIGYKYEIVLYEKPIDKNDNCFFIYLVTALFNSQCDDNEILFTDIKEMFYPIRLKINEKEKLTLSYWEILRENIFNEAGKPLTIISKKLKEKGLLLNEQHNQIYNKESPNKSPYIESIHVNNTINFDYLQNNKVYLYTSTSPSDLSDNFNHYYLGTENVIYREPKLELEDLFYLYNKPKRSQITCPQCKKLQSIETTISKLPVYLCLYIRRFYYDYRQQSFIKNNVFIDYQNIINISNFVNRESNYSFETNTPSNECEYELFAIVKHLGTLDFGHYVANIKVSNEWYCFNDRNVYHITNHVSRDALVLFYKRKSCFE
jgi:ubiquitin C-terminal hydrolase